MGACRRHLSAGALATAGAIAISSCGAGAIERITARIAAKRAEWVTFASVHTPIDLAGPRGDRSFALVRGDRLGLLKASGQVQPFASGYVSPGVSASSGEPYITLSPGGCFGQGTVYALRLTSGPGVVAVGARGEVRRVATLSAPGVLNGFAFDQTGSFRHRLLVTSTAGARTTVYAIDCKGAVTTITRKAPMVEGGIAVAPPTFGRFGGDLIAPDEFSGKLFAITPHGKRLLVARSGLPHGGDIGVESEGFVPTGSHDAFVSDRLTPDNRYPGHNQVLRIGASALKAAGVRPGDLLVATEAGALTDAISCSAAGCQVRLVATGPADAISCSAAGCQVRFVATGPKVAHLEGHIAFR